MAMHERWRNSLPAGLKNRQLIFIILEVSSVPGLEVDWNLLLKSKYKTKTINDLPSTIVFYFFPPVIWYKAGEM